MTQVDVLVVGGGTAGFGAAVAAGRAGLSVAMVEATSKVGGVMAFCPGMPWGGAYPVDQIIGGLIEELTNRLQAMDPPAVEKRPCTLENFGPEILYDYEMAPLTMFEMLEEAGVEVRLNTLAVAPELAPVHGEGAAGWRRITSVFCHDRRGAFEIRPSVVIDCSGDGDISAKAGVPYTVGDGDGNMMGVTVSFHMNNVDWGQAFAEPDPYFTRFAEKGVAEGRLHPDLAMLYLMKGFHPGTVFCNSVHIRGVDGTNPAAVTRATQEGRRRCRQLADFLRTHVPGFASAYMSLLSPTVGVRETRRLKAVYKVTGADLLAGRKFEDGIVCCDNPVDDVMRGDGEMTHDAAVGQGDYYRLPFRALGTAAGLMLLAEPVGGGSVQTVDTDKLVRSLTDQGVRGLGHNSLRSVG